MAIVTIAQRTPEWHAWRAGLDLPDQKPRIMASEIAVIMGESPFKSAHQLWLEKTGRIEPLPPTVAMNHGTFFEDEAREALEEETGEMFFPVCATSDDHPEFGASLDGINLDRRVIAEIKCPYGEASHLVAEGGAIPKHYYLQVQWQMMCSGAERGWYYSYFTRAADYSIRKKAIPFWADPGMWPAMVEAALKFRRHIIDDTPPVAEAYLDVARQWRLANARLAEQVAVLADKKREVEAIEAIIKGMMPEGDDEAVLEGGGLKSSRFAKTGAIDYPALVESLAVDKSVIESFRKKSSIGFRFTESKKEEMPALPAPVAPVNPETLVARDREKAAIDAAFDF